MTLAEAHESFLADREAGGLRKSTRQGYESLFRRWAKRAHELKRSDLGDWDAAALRAWRESWDCGPGTHRVRLARIKAFFGFAVEEGWVAESPARYLRPPKEAAPPTMPLSVNEMRSLLRSAAAISPRVRAFVLLMRYSGLAIQDAATLARNKVDGSLLTLRRGKSGELVQVDLPKPVVAALESLPDDGQHYFWTGKSDPVTAAKLWRRRLRDAADRAKVDKFRPHRLRDTFAVELLLAEVSMQDVADLLGHSSVRTTERYYAPWNKSRRDRLVRVVRAAHGRDRLLKEISQDNDGRAAGSPEEVAGQANAEVAAGRPAR